MAVTTLELAAAFEKQERTDKNRPLLPLKVLATTNGILLLIATLVFSMPELFTDLYTLSGLPELTIFRNVDAREPAYMAFAILWLMAVVYMHVDEINETRLALRCAPETETIRAFTVEDLIGYIVRGAAFAAPSFGLYLFPSYLHGASPAAHLVFAGVFACEFLLWRFVRRG